MAITAGVYKLMESHGVFIDLFDTFRLVNPEKGILMESAAGGTVTETATSCMKEWDLFEQCENCAALRAFSLNEAVTQLEYIKDEALLFICKPVEIEGRPMVAELVKNITQSVTDKAESGEISLGGQAGQQGGNMQQNEEKDLLTQLHSRAYFEQKLSEQVDMFTRLADKLFLTIIDVENYEKIKKEQGMDMANAALVVVGSILAKYARRGADWAARTEENRFFLCYPGAKEMGIDKLMSNIRQEIETTPVKCDDKTVTISVKMGYTELVSEDTKESLITRCSQLISGIDAKTRYRISPLA